MNASLPALLGFPFGAPPAAGEAIEVARGIFWLRMPLPFALDHINLWLLADGKTWTQVDCGYGNAATRSLWETHFEGTLQRRPLRRVIATHYHPDHLGNAAWLVDRFRCPLVMPQAEYLTAHMMGNGYASYGTGAICELFRVHGMDEAHLEPMRARGNHYRRGVPELPTTYKRIIDGDIVAIGNRRWRSFAGYGHSPEHMALHCEELAVCISGDMLLPRISTNVAISASEPDGDPLGRFLDSLAGFASLPPDTLVLPSHGLPFVGAAVRVAQLHAHHAARLAEREDAAQEPRSAADLVPVLFRRELDVQQRFFAMGEAIAHLNHLWHAGRLARIIEDDGRMRFRRTS